MINKNITYKLTLGFLIIVIFSTLFIGIISLNVFKNNIYSIKKNNMKNHGTAIAKNIEPYISNNLNNKEFVKIFKLLDSTDNSKIWILDSKKNIITASAKNDEIVKYINDSKIKKDYRVISEKVLSGKEQYDEMYNPYYDEEMMIVAVPIKNNNEVVGAIILNSSINDISRSMDRFFLYLLLTLGGEILIVGFIGYYFSRSISKPIKKINQSALELARGNYGIITNIYQKDEIGELSSSFDLLSLKLQYTISELNEEKNKLNSIIDEKEKLEQMRKDFISNVSHEFRTPLTVIKGNLESIVDGITKKEEIPDTCITLIKETNRLERMVKDLLNLSRLESGKVELQIDKLDVNMLITDILRSFKRIIKDKQIEFQLSMEEDLTMILSDYDKVKQLFIIFLDNAIKFSKNNGKIKVQTYSDDKKIYIKIADNGIGIPKEEIQFLGEKFYKADKSRDSKVEGTGLGLSIAKRLIKVLNGDFSIDSEVGSGTTITISFSIEEK